MLASEEFASKSDEIPVSRKHVRDLVEKMVAYMEAIGGGKSRKDFVEILREQDVGLLG